MYSFREMRRTLALAVMLVAACTASAERAKSKRDPGALVVAQATGAIALDPVRVTDNESIEAGTLMFEGLVHWKPGTTDPVPGLAKSWQVSPDGKTWKFELRTDVEFHDGTRLDAAAVKFSFARVIDPRAPHYIASATEVGYWRLLFKDVKDVRVVDAHTVEIETVQPYAPLLGELAMFPIVSPTAVEKYGDAFQAHPVGTGPFAFESWVMGEQLVVKRFERYWGPPAGLERVVFQVVVDPRQRLIDLESGQVDLAVTILPDEQSFVELHPDLQLHHVASNDVSYLAMNTQRPPFDDVRVRRAVNYAIDKEPIVKLAYQGRAIPAAGPLPPTQWGYHPPLKTYGYDPVAARRLLAEAAQDHKFDPDKTYRLYVITTPRPYMPQPEQVGRFVQAGLEQVGLHTELVLQAYAEHNRSVSYGEHDMAIFGWIGDTGDPDNFLYVLFHSDNALVGEAQNIAFLHDDHVDQLLRDAQRTVDNAQRTGLYARAQDAIMDLAPWAPLAHSEVVVAGRRELSGVVLSPLGHPIFPLIRRTGAPDVR